MEDEPWPCHKCRRPVPLRLLDAKPESGDENDDWELFLCRECYGPGWLPAWYLPGEDHFVNLTFLPALPSP